MILVETDQPGVSTADVEKKMGIRSTATSEVVFKDVRVPATNLIGEENRGFYHVLEFFDESQDIVTFPKNKNFLQEKQLLIYDQTHYIFFKS